MKLKLMLGVVLICLMIQWGSGEETAEPDTVTPVQEKVNILNINEFI